MKVKKRDGSLQEFDSNKIKQAIIKANGDTEEDCQIWEGEIDSMVCEIIGEVTSGLYGGLSHPINKDWVVDIEEIQDAVELCLQREGYYYLAKNYIKYRYQRELAREFKKRDESILSLLHGSNDELKTENSNKNTTLASTQRDYMAGEVAKDLAKRLLLPKHIVKAHEDGVLHFHDMDYSPAQSLFNCCLINIKDMLDNGTCVNGTKIDSPSSFPTACTIVTQIIASVASGQYGGQSVNVKHLGKYLKRSYDKYVNLLDANEYRVYYSELDRIVGEHEIETKKEMAYELMLKDLRDGVQTIQYQINTISCTNGQTPFVTLFLELDPEDEYLEYTALIIEEILKQRIKGVKNEVGAWVTPVFPKLVYVLDEHNNLSGGKYDYITHLAAKCTAKRMYPDYISAKKMREHYQGNVFSPMGCRSFLSPWKDENGEYKFEGRFNQGVVTINLPQIALAAKEGFDNAMAYYDEGKISAEYDTPQDELFAIFKEELDERLQLCFDALMFRHKSLLGTKSDISPIHWQHGCLARLGKGEVIDPLLYGYYSTISLGYIGLYEVTKLMTGEQHTSGKGKEFAMWLMNYLRETVDTWKAETNIGFALYGTPAESLCYRFAKIDKTKYGSIKDVTDKDYYTNSYHVDVREPIDAFTKLELESEFQRISSGGCISYIEVPNLQNNVPVIEEVIKYIYENVQYGEFNTKLDYCMECGYSGELLLDENNEWYCPNCGNKDTDRMNLVRRVCGYLGANLFNEGKTNEIKQRVLHLGME